MKKNCTIIKNANLTASLYHENGTIFFLTDDKKTTIAEKTLPSFNTIITTDKNIILFYREISGNAYLTKLLPFEKNNSRRLSSCDIFENSYSCILAQSNNLNSFFFYTSPSGEKNIFHLFATNLSDDQTLKIDSIVPVAGQDFIFFQDQYPFLVYKNEQNMLILCIFNSNTLSQNTKYILSRRADCISDVSCLIENGCIHICYIIKQKNTFYLIYKHLKDSFLSKNQILNDGDLLKNCTLFLSEDAIFIFCIKNNAAYYTFSTNSGASFHPSSIYFKNISPTGKAKYISTTENNFIAHEILIDGNTPLLLTDFSSQHIQLQTTALKDTNVLTEKIVLLEKDISEKKLQITKLTSAVTDAQQQGSVFMQQLKGRCNEMAQENNRLAQLVASLTHERDSLIITSKKLSTPELISEHLSVENPSLSDNNLKTSNDKFG